MSAVPKAVLYYSPISIWSSTVLLALEEKGYAEDEFDTKVVDLSKGENFAPSFLRLNPKATVPTLVVPLQKTLSEDVDSRYKAITETKAIVEFLDKSRSALSRTHTTSSAPAPALAPATIAFSSASNVIIDDLLHSQQGNPNSLKSLNARDEASLRILAAELLPKVQGKHQALVQYISDAQSEKIHVSEKTKSFWAEKKTATEAILDVYKDAQKPTAGLDAAAKQKREEFFQTAKEAWEVSLKAVLLRLSQDIIGPFTLGEQISLADLHLAAWLTRIAALSGAKATDDGNTVIAKLERHIEEGFTLPKETQPTGQQSKLAVFWDVVKERPSWKKVYADGLH